MIYSGSDENCGFRDNETQGLGKGERLSRPLTVGENDITQLITGSSGVIQTKMF